MDYRLYHWINELARQHRWLGQTAATLELWSIPLFVVATFALWLFARPGPARKWNLACGSALASAALALLANQAVAVFWNRARPYATHPDATLFGARSHDPSFPSDHASAAFIVVRLARPPVARIVGVLERLTDPFVALVWRFAPGGPRPATD